MRALIVDQARDRASLAAARMLHADGWEVGTGAFERSTVSRSAATGMHHRVEEAEVDEDRFIADIAAAVRVGGYEVVFCSYDVGLLVLSRRRAEIAPAIVPYAPARGRRALLRQARLHARRAGGRAWRAADRRGQRGGARAVAGPGRRQGPDPRADAL